MTEPATSKLPPIAEILLEKSLYEEMEFSHADAAILEPLFHTNFQIDAHCTGCKKETVFKTMRSYGGGSGINTQPTSKLCLLPGRKFTAVVCQRCSGEYAFYFLQITDRLMKIGQYPSIEDINSAEINKFRGILGVEEFRELKRAGGLYSHGIGIGAFVYLRRIFERLVWAHYQDLKDRGEAPEGFERMRMAEKIGSLSTVLPAALVANRKAYGILSKGIHELDEETCRKFFPAVRRAIIQILDQDLASREAARDAKELEKELAAIADLVGKDDGE